MSSYTDVHTANATRVTEVNKVRFILKIKLTMQLGSQKSTRFETPSSDTLKK